MPVSYHRTVVFLSRKGRVLKENAVLMNARRPHACCRPGEKRSRSRKRVWARTEVPPSSFCNRMSHADGQWLESKDESSVVPGLRLPPVFQRHQLSSSGDRTVVISYVIVVCV